MRRVIACCVVIFCLGVAGAVAQSRNVPLAKKIVGAWRLVAVEGQPPGLPGFYDHPTGLIVYDPSGMMSVQIQGSDRMVLIPREDCKGVTVARKDATYRLYWGRLK